ncbi:gastrin-releasing peptide [Astatotilapia calliptera]|uniref:Gastrin-releasing peptide n=2 Tax=Haplochromini TaxID=319058 RepID=A0A3P9CXR3_9CICH|nr:gastrin-releasing peptide isoform X1 [Maylandia zebra]XP_026029360.1 gastrin-releasing peptide [Astatotilapia calliptera]
MGGECLWYSWTCRPVWPVLIILATVPCILNCSESPAAVVGKMYPRGNHWAVGHLMGKKSIEEEQEVNPDRDYLTALKPARLTQHLMQALMQPENPNQMMPQTADRLLQRHWREEDKEKYLAEMSDLLLLALKLQDSDST